MDFFNAPYSNPDQSKGFIFIFKTPKAIANWVIVFDPRACPDSTTATHIQFSSGSGIDGSLESEYCRGRRMKFYGDMPLATFVPALRAGQVVEDGKVVSFDFFENADTVYDLNDYFGLLRIMRGHYHAKYLGSDTYPDDAPGPFEIEQALAQSNLKFYGGALDGGQQVMPSPFVTTHPLVVSLRRR